MLNFIQENEEASLPKKILGIKYNEGRRSPQKNAI